MNRSRSSIWILVAITLIAAACAQQPQQPAEPPDTRAADEAAIRSAAKDWAAAAQAKDADRFASFYMEDATLLLEDAPDFSGKAAIREAIAGMMQDPAFALSFETTKVGVARSGDIAYETSTYSITTTDPKTKKPMTETGAGVVVWKKQPDGSWKVQLDIPVSDATAPAAPPAPPPPPAKK
jgi:uncharacterized protein (TIGR02246 family)